MEIAPAVSPPISRRMARLSEADKPSVLDKATSCCSSGRRLASHGAITVSGNGPARSGMLTDNGKAPVVANHLGS
jgi:hypothetical protein